jgi:hypothetical protein
MRRQQQEARNDSDESAQSKPQRFLHKKGGSGNSKRVTRDHRPEPPAESAEGKDETDLDEMLRRTFGEKKLDE